MLVTEERSLRQTLRNLAGAFGGGWLRAFFACGCGGLGSKCVEGAEEGGAAVDARRSWDARRVIHVS